MAAPIRPIAAAPMPAKAVGAAALVVADRLVELAPMGTMEPVAGPTARPPFVLEEEAWLEDAEAELVEV